MGKREFYWVRTGDEAKGEDGLRLAEVYVRDGHRDIYLTGRVECFDEHQVKLVRRIALPGEIDAGFARDGDLEAIYQAGFDAAPVEGIFRTDVDPDRMRADIASLIGRAA